MASPRTAGRSWVLACRSLLTPGSHSPGLQCSPLRWVHDLEGCRWGRCQRWPHGLLPFRPRLGGAVSCAEGHLAPSRVALLRGRVETPCWALRLPPGESQGQGESRGPWTMADADHTEPWARLDRQGPAPECPQEALGPAGQTGAPLTRVSTGSPGTAGCGPSHQCPRSLLRAPRRCV